MEVQGYPWIHREFEASLRYMRTILRVGGEREGGKLGGRGGRKYRGEWRGQKGEGKGTEEPWVHIWSELNAKCFKNGVHCGDVATGANTLYHLRRLFLEPSSHSHLSELSGRYNYHVLLVWEDSVPLREAVWVRS